MIIRLLYLLFVFMPLTYAKASGSGNVNPYIGKFPGNQILSFTEGQRIGFEWGCVLDSVKTIKTNTEWMKQGEDSLSIIVDSDTLLIVSFYTESWYVNSHFLYDLCYSPEKKEIQLIAYPYGLHGHKPVFGEMTYFKHTFFIRKEKQHNRNLEYDTIRAIKIIADL